MYSIYIPNVYAKICLWICPSYSFIRTSTHSRIANFSKQYLHVCTLDLSSMYDHILLHIQHTCCLLTAWTPFSNCTAEDVTRLIYPLIFPFWHILFSPELYLPHLYHFTCILMKKIPFLLINPIHPYWTCQPCCVSFS